MRPAWLFIFSIALNGWAIGQSDGSPENWCREGLFTRESVDFRIARVTGAKGERAYFHHDRKPECPGAADCRAGSYLVPGDKVVISKRHNGYACAWYAPVKGSPTVGWIDSARLSRAESPIVAGLSPWLGEWRYAENTINLTENKLAGFLNVSGTAFWRGVGDNVHVGEIDGRYEPKKGVIDYSDGDGQYDCRATLRLLGRYLIVADNLNCGGVNVSFSGIYLKRGK